MYNFPQSHQPQPDHGRGSQLRLHQAHDAHVDASAEWPTEHADRHELAGVVGKLSCRLRQQAASAMTHCGMLARRLGSDQHNMAILNEVVESIKTLETLVDGLSDYAADQPPHCESVSIKRLVDEVLETLKPRFTRQKISVEVNVASALTLEVDRRMIASAIRHLTQNAAATMNRGGQIVITAVSTQLGIELEVADSGPGLSEDELPRAFTTAHHGPAGTSGVERAIARQVATAHGGQISARNCPEGGTAYTLLFPARRSRQAA